VSDKGNILLVLFYSPNNGPKLKRAIALPLSAGINKSATDPPPTARAADPKNPAEDPHVNWDIERRREEDATHPEDEIPIENQYFLRMRIPK
jgi:hypothetical protein